MGVPVQVLGAGVPFSLGPGVGVPLVQVHVECPWSSAGISPAKTGMPPEQATVRTVNLLAVLRSRRTFLFAFHLGKLLVCVCSISLF